MRVSCLGGFLEAPRLRRMAEIGARQSIGKEGQISDQLPEQRVASLGRFARAAALQFTNVNQLHGVEQRQRHALFGRTPRGSFAAWEFADVLAQPRQLKS